MSGMGESLSPENPEVLMATMTRDPFLCFWEGKDAGPDDANPYEPGTACWHGWRHGHEAEYGERRPMSPGEVEAEFERLRTPH